MERLDVKECDLDYIMENYFNTDKEVIFLCDYKTAWEILKYSEYENEDFSSYFGVDINCEYPYYSVYKNSNEVFIIEFLTKLDGKLYSEYEADNILIQDCVLNEYGDNILEKCHVNDLLEEQCDCCKCCDECCEEEKDNEHYNRMRGFLTYDIEERDIQEQKEILEAIIKVANDLKEELETNTTKMVIMILGIL